MDINQGNQFAFVVCSEDIKTDLNKPTPFVSGTNMVDRSARRVNKDFECNDKGVPSARDSSIFKGISGVNLSNNLPHKKKPVTHKKKPVKRSSNYFKEARDMERQTMVSTFSSTVMAGRVNENFPSYDRVSFPKSTIISILKEGLGVSLMPKSKFGRDYYFFGTSSNRNTNKDGQFAFVVCSEDIKTDLNKPIPFVSGTNAVDRSARRGSNELNRDFECSAEGVPSARDSSVFKGVSGVDLNK